MRTRYRIFPTFVIILIILSSLITIFLVARYFVSAIRVPVVAAIAGTPNSALAVLKHYVIATTSYNAGLLRVYDISNIKSPRRISEQAVTYSPDSSVRSGAVTDLAVTTDRIYVVARGGYEPKDPWSLVIFDATDLSHPQAVGAWSQPGVAIHGMSEHSGMVYLATEDTTGHRTVRAIDVHEPGRPTQVSNIALKVARIDIAVDDGVLWIEQAGNLTGLNVGDPEELGLLGSTLIPPECRDADNGVQIHYQLVYLVTSKGICVFDVSRPTAPNLLHQVSRSNWAQIGDVLITDERLIFSDAFGVETFNGLRIYHLDSRQGPRTLGSTGVIKAVPLSTYRGYLLTSGYWLEGHDFQELIIAEMP